MKHSRSRGPYAASAGEQRFGDLLKEAGLNFETGVGVGWSIPDQSFPLERVAVFFDGCYWHGCPDHAADTERTRRFREKDARVNDALERSGWKVFRVWEHEDPQSIIGEIAAAVRSRRAEVIAAKQRHRDQHEAGTWCDDCSDEPHDFIDDETGWCLRCAIHRSDHDEVVVGWAAHV